MMKESRDAGRRPTLLEVQGLSTHYVSARGTRVTRAVEDVSFTLRDGETLGIVGESGSGKSTLALSLLRLLPPAARIVAGAVRFEGEDLLNKPESEMRRIRGKRIAMILQDPMASLNPLFTVGDQVGEPLRVHEGATRRGAWNRARELLGAVRISAPATRVRNYPHELSGGMRQRIVGAIAISCGPRVLIADEPTTSLDVTIQAQYLNLLRDLQRAHQLTLKVPQEVQVLRLDREVEARRGLVGDEHPRLARDRDRPDDPLSHPARELVGILAHARFGRRDANRLQELLRPAPGLA